MTINNSSWGFYHGLIRIIKIQWRNKNENYVVINHGTINGKVVTNEYGHISSWSIKAGQKVTQGQVVAKSGNTGGSTGPHVHVTIKENGIPVPPSKYIMY